MLAAYLASAALVVVLSLLAGAALVVLCGRCDLLALSPAFGLGALLIATGVTTDLGGGESALALALGGLAVGAPAVLA
nr:hypothetical protein [Solirubrobacterales bacterium]